MGVPENCQNTGKCIPEVGRRQQRRKIKELKTQVERSLWFAETHGLHLGFLKLSELIIIPIGKRLPQSYLVNQCKDSLNQLCHIEHTPAKNEGAPVNLCDALRNAIQKHVKSLINHHQNILVFIFT